MNARPLRHDGPRLALVLIWLGTALASTWDGGAAGSRMLQSAGLAAGSALALVWAGAGWDLLIGLWLALRPGRVAYRAAFWGMLLMTLTATLLLPALWLDPLAPLLKNFAIAALLAQRLHA